MAYHYEKEANGDEALVIDGWEKGTAPDPYSGLNRMNQVDISVPGEVSVGYPVTASSVTGGTLGIPIADSTRFFAYGSPGVPTGSAQSFAILDAGGQVFESTSISGSWAFLSSSNSTSGSSSTDGICYWLGYLFKTRGANIDYWNGSTWSTGWKTTLTGGVKHFMYVASNNVLYITNGNYLASLTAATPSAFDPTNPATYAFSVVKLQLPVTDQSLSLAEVGSGNSGNSTLLIGGTQNAIYPWDKVSSSFALPIYVGDAYIKLMISVNQNVFIFPGNAQGRGRIYITNGSQADLFFKMPDYLFGVNDPYYEWGDAIFHRNNLIFGCFINSNAGTTQSFAEVWAVDLDTKAFRSISDISTATGKMSATALLSTSSLTSPGFGYLVAWSDTSVGGVGRSNSTVGVGSANIITDYIPVGTAIRLKTYRQLEFKLRSALQSGESITISSMVNPDQVTVQLGTTSFSVDGGVMSGIYPVNFQKSQWLQFQIAMTGNSASSGVRLKELRLR